MGGSAHQGQQAMLPIKNNPTTFQSKATASVSHLGQPINVVFL